MRYSLCGYINPCNYHTRSRYDVQADEDSDVKGLNKKLNYRSQKSNTTSFGLEPFRWLGPKIRELVTDNVKQAKSPSAFENTLKKFDIVHVNLAKMIFMVSAT